MKKDFKKIALRAHKKLNGKIETGVKAPVRSRDDLSIWYTPGVGAVSSFLATHKKEARIYTIKGNTIAVVSDGSAVLGLGNIGPVAALPVMEGKCMLFKEFGGVNAFPIVLDTQDTDAIVAAVKAIAPGFGGINLEDISAPRCFEIEARLKRELAVPVFHDDQHGTAIVVLAGLINAFRVVGKDIKKATVAIVGAGAAGAATAKLLKRYGVRDVIVADSTGVIHKSRRGLSGYKRDLARLTNRTGRTGGVRAALSGADAVIGVSGPGTLTRDDIAAMAERAVVFSLANPVPEIMPEEAARAGAMVIATGRSDYPNQINNSLVFPGIFRGALDAGVRNITDAMKLRAAEALAGMVRRPSARRIIPSMFEKGVAKAIAASVRKA